MGLHLADELTRLAVIDYRTARHLDDLVLAVLTERTALTALATVCRHDMLLVFQMQQGPQVTVAVQNDRTAFASVTAVRTAFGQVLGAMKVHAVFFDLLRK